MKFLTFEKDGAYVPGLLHEQRICDLAAARAAGADVPGTFDALVAGGPRSLAAIGEAVTGLAADAECWLEPDAVRIGPAVPDARKILCVGLNYRAHANEAGMDIPTVPILFSKFANALAADGEAVRIGHLEKTDYEAELAVVVGRTARRIGTDEALDHVFGYCCANDLSEREMQMRTSQWLIGKTHDGFLPIGPWLVTADEVGDPQSLGIRGWLNGELRQDSHTSDMVFGVAEIVSYASHYMTLAPGDVIVTGTPEGVILGRRDKVWLKPGDEYVVEIEKLGRLHTRLAD